MFVPIVPYTKVVNKTIIFSDTVLTSKDTGKNLKIISINNVSEACLEDCLKTIFKCNPNVIFNTVQYSKNDEKVYFYTDKEITIREFEESKFIKRKPINSRLEILEEVKTLLISDGIKDNDCISLYDIAVLISQTNFEYKILEDKYDEYFNYIIKSEFGNCASLIIYDFDYENNELAIGFKYLGKDYDDIIFTKEEGDLYISKSKSYYDKEILNLIGVDLSELYDEFMKFSALKKETSYRINSVNSNFFVNICPYGVDIFTKSLTNDFELTFCIYNDEYNYDCNSTTIISTLMDKEDEIFKRIFVKISDCPKWSLDMLYEIRHNQLVEDKIIEEVKKYKEMKKQKRLELVRRILPFLKK